MKIKSIKKIQPEESRCLTVDSPFQLFTLSNGLLTGNSVIQQNIAWSVLLRPKEWQMIGIDLKKVELTNYRKYGIPVASTMEDAGVFIEFCQALMMKRYTEMEELNINNYSKMPEDKKGPAFLLLIDEFGEIANPIKGKSDEAQELAQIQEQIMMNLSSIARLGRAAQVFIVLATQRPAGDIIPMSIRDNLAIRVGAGRLKSNTSQMLFGSSGGTRIRSNPKGGVGVQIHGGQVNLGQGFYEDQRWIDNYFASHGGFNADALDKIEEIKSLKAKSDSPTKSDGRPEDSWDEEMEAIYDVKDQGRR